MTMPKTTEILLNLPSRIARRAYAEVKARQLQAINRHSKSPVVHPGGPVVSLTSYGKRIDTTYLAIESIANGSLLPSELILWLDDEARIKSLPIALKRLEQRGLTVRLCKNYGPHKKYYPYVDSQQEFARPMVTADDDVLYPKDWLKTLNEAYERNSNVVNGYRARVISFHGDRIAPYTQWTLCGSTKASWRHFLNGTSGVIYPPGVLAALKSAGSEFEQCCPRNDDFWLHAVALRAGFRIQQIKRKAIHFPFIPGSQAQEVSLMVENAATGNDVMVAKTYSDRDLQRLAEG
jgi:hypothetical protein